MNNKYREKTDSDTSRTTCWMDLGLIVSVLWSYNVAGSFGAAEYVVPNLNVGTAQH